VRSLISSTTQKLFSGVGVAMTPESPIVRQPWIGNAALVGAMADGIAASEPRVTFTVWAASLANLGTLTAVLQTTIYPMGANSAPYTMTEDVTGTLLLSRGTVVCDLSPYAAAKVGLVVTNRDTSAQTVRVQTQLHGGRVVDAGREAEVSLVRAVS